MIPFNKPPYTGNEDQYVTAAIRSNKMCGDGVFTLNCQRWLEKNLQCRRAFLTPSCTHALEMAAILLGIKAGDEIIMPSYTFVSTANAFVLRGAKIIFVDVRADTMNIDERLIEAAITERTVAIVPVHYAGVACEMNIIMALAAKYNLYVIEDAAQAIGSTYNGQPVGSFGHMAALSFHETKNITSGGEGGALLINDEQFISRAEIVREKGTNRSQFFRGVVDKYTWVDQGSSYLPGELQAAYLWGQLEKIEAINSDRLASWKQYHSQLLPLTTTGLIQFPYVPPNCAHNAHMFYIKLNSLQQRSELIVHLQVSGVQATFHYVPLHNAPAGQKFGHFYGKDRYTTTESDLLLRLPLWYGISADEILEVSSAIKKFILLTDTSTVSSSPNDDFYPFIPMVGGA